MPGIPAVDQVIGSNAHELPFRAQTFDEERKLELEEDDRIDRWTSVDGIAVFDPIPYER